MNCTAGELIPRISLDEDGRDDGVAVASQVLPTPLDVADLVGRQFGLGISQIFRVPIELNEMIDISYLGVFAKTIKIYLRVLEMPATKATIPFFQACLASALKALPNSSARTPSRTVPNCYNLIRNFN